jgi:hypothetical protein
MDTLLLQRRLINLLRNLSGVLRDEDFDNAQEAVLAGEPSLAMDIICQQLYEYETRISRRQYDEIKVVAQVMSLPERTWQFLESLVNG